MILTKHSQELTSFFIKNNCISHERINPKTREILTVLYNQIKKRNIHFNIIVEYLNGDNYVDCNWEKWLYTPHCLQFVTPENKETKKKISCSTYTTFPPSTCLII